MLATPPTERKKPATNAAEEDGSIGITDPALIRRFTDNPDFPYLISFPRTGSHWLRMLMELYFEKPSLVRAFYANKLNDFTCFHWHDEDLKLRRRNVLYLYRNPVPTVYSQINYYQEDPNDQARIAYWSALYGQHLKKWLLNDFFTNKKSVLTYEALKARMPEEFGKVCRHLGLPFDAAKLREVSARVTKGNLKKKTTHDQQVVNLSANYETGREQFQETHAGWVMENVMAQDARLHSLFGLSS